MGDAGKAKAAGAMGAKYGKDPAALWAAMRSKFPAAAVDGAYGALGEWKAASPPLTPCALALSALYGCVGDAGKASVGAARDMAAKYAAKESELWAQLKGKAAYAAPAEAVYAVWKAVCQ